MKHLKLFTLFCFIFINCVSLAQQFKYGEVSIEELAEEEHPVYPNADAAILFKAQNISYGYDQDGFYREITVYMRVKIYTSDGFNFGNEIIGMHDAKGFHDQLINLQGVTHNLNSQEIISTNLEVDNQYLDKVNKSYSLQKISFPEVNEGSIIEYKYTKRTNNTGYIPRIYFQESIPVNKCAFIIEAPEKMAFSVHMHGLIPIKPTFTKSIKPPGDFGDGWRVMMTEFGDINGDIVFNQMNIILDSLPAFTYEPFVDHAENYRSSVLLELTHYESSRRSEQSMSLSWEDIADYFYNHSNFGDRMRAPLYFRKFARQATRSDDDDLAKVNRVYNLVKDRMTWNNYSTCYTESLTRAYENKTGSSADINLILCEMLTTTGVEAYPVVLSTRNNGLILTPNIIGMNYVIVVAKVDGKNILLDATFKEGKVGMLPERALNYRGILIGENFKTEPINLMPQRVSYDFKSATVQIDSTGAMVANCKLQSSRYVAARKKQRISFVGEDDYTKQLSAQYVSDVKDYSNSGLENSANSFTETFALTLTDAYDQIGENFYINPMLLFEHKEIYFQEDERLYPMDFTFPKKEKISLTITIPEDLEIVQLPKTMQYDLPQNEGGYSFEVKQNGNDISFNTNLGYENSYYEPIAFPFFKEMYQTVLQAESQQLVLRKKSTP